MSEEKNTKKETKKKKQSADASVEATASAKKAQPTDGGQVSADGEGEEVEVPKKFQTIVSTIEQMSVLDLHELVQVFEKKFGVSAAAVAAAPADGGDDEDEGGGLVTVKLEDAGATKIQVIKVVKEVLDLGLKEAKDIVDAAPKDLKEGLTGEEAEELKGKLEEAGAKASVA